MLTRRSSLGVLALLVSGIIAGGGAVARTALAGLTAEKLFFIQRSKNANEVHYDARVQPDGTLDPKNPVEGYWLNKAEGGGRDSISLLQRIAYGWDVDAAAGGAWTMKLKAFPDRPLTIERVGGRWRARTIIAGKAAYLTRLYVATDESGVIPKVLFVDLFGDDVDGKPAQEHIVKR
jgi:hypothetical protein